MANPPAPLRFHWLRLRATSHGTEDPERVATAVGHVAGMDAEELAKDLEQNTLPAHHGGQVTWIESKITRNRAIRDFVERLAQEESLRTAIVNSLDQRVDEEGTLFLRFAKQAAFLGHLELTSGEDAVHARLRVQVHPGTREGAMQAWQSIFQAT